MIEAFLQTWLWKDWRALADMVYPWTSSGTRLWNVIGQCAGVWWTPNIHQTSCHIIYVYKLAYANKALLCYSLCRSLLASRFLSDPWFLRQYLSSVFHCDGNVHGRIPVDCIRSVANYSIHAMLGWRGGGHIGGKKIVRVCVCTRNYYGAQFIAPKTRPRSRVPVRILCPTGDWGDELRGSCSSTTPATTVIVIPAIEPTTYVWNEFLKFFPSIILYNGDIFSRCCLFLLFFVSYR